MASEFNETISGYKPRQVDDKMNKPKFEALWYANMNYK